ncbi:MAG: radical SAM protein [Promethearchaeota archaeon]
MPLPRKQNKNPQLILISQYFGSIVYNRLTSQYFAFDRETTDLLIRLSSKPFDRILSEMKESKHKTHVLRFYEHFYERGFFTLDQKFAGTILNVDPPSDHLVGPLTVHLEVVDSCNLKCKHCFAGNLPRNEQALSLNELEELFVSMASIGTFRLGLTGGEPLLRQDLFEIIDLALDYGLSPCLTTNGLLITEEIALELGKRDLAWLNVSMEGASSQTHDYIRGNGTFNKVIDRISILSDYTRFSLAFTIMRSNIQEIKACAELAHRVGAEAAVFRPLYPVGSVQHNPELLISFSEYLHALKELSDMREHLPGTVFQFCSIHPWGPQTRINSQSLVYTNFGCGAGNTVCSVSVSGDVSPCSFLDPSYIAGNIRDTSFQSIWHNSRTFKEIRSLPGNENCVECKHYGICGGGCRARALFLNGSINAPDPYCLAD